MTRQDVIAWLTRRGYVAKATAPSLFYNPDKPGRRYRVTDLGLRREHRLSHGEWMRMTSGYFKNLSLLDGDLISGLSQKGM